MANKRKKNALICGISGQDGAYLAKYLLSKGYQVFGSSRNIKTVKYHNLKTLDIASQVHIISLLPTDMNSILEALAISNPDEIYNLSGQSSVGLSYKIPEETSLSIVDASKNILEGIRIFQPKARFFNAGSGECFGGSTADSPSDEKSIFNPKSPYALAKTQAHRIVEEYREIHGLYACTGILFNHESPLRPKSFVTQKIVQAALEISKKIKTGEATDKLYLGNLEIKRDWGWAPDYVIAMWLMLQRNNAEDFIIATGKTRSLAQFVEAVFTEVSCNWKDHVVVDPSLFRLNEAIEMAANPSKARQLLGWESTKSIKEIAKLMVSSGTDIERKK
jgi:GDPmannose 4,6-dehydratase